MSHLTTYQDALAYLNSHINYEAFSHSGKTSYHKFSLEPILQIAELVGNPQNELKFIHVAGTKGKGSVCMQLEYQLRQLGFTTGLYTSPHLYEPNERVRLNGIALNDEQFTEMLNDFKVLIERACIKISYFEILTIASLLYFRKKKVDWVILETGIGGRLDATNIVTPAVSVITRIDLDHTNLLGKTHSAIASEKAGIIKKNTPVIALQQRPDVNDVFESFAKANTAELSLISPMSSREETTPYGLAELENISLVKATLQKLQSLQPTAFQKLNLDKVKPIPLPGRYECFQYKNKLIMLDVAHNPISYLRLIEKLNQHYSSYTKALAFNSSQDKDIQNIFQNIKEHFSEIYLLPASNPRLFNTKILHELLNEGVFFDSLIEGIESIFKTTKADMIVFTGSFYLVGEVGKYFHRTANY